MRKNILKLIPLLMIAGLVACAAVPVKYEDGFRENKNSAGVYTVEFRGNGNTTPESTEKALIYRCAELTLKEGYDHFTFYTKSRNDKVTWGSGVAVPAFYGVIHLHKGTVAEGYDAKTIVAAGLPEDIQN